MDHDIEDDEIEQQIAAELANIDQIAEDNTESSEEVEAAEAISSEGPNSEYPEAKVLSAYKAQLTNQSEAFEKQLKDCVDLLKASDGETLIQNKERFSLYHVNHLIS